MHALASIMRSEGMAGLFRGLGPTIVTNAPYSAFYYLFYTSLQQRMQQVRSHAVAGAARASTVVVQCCVLSWVPSGTCMESWARRLGASRLAICR